jgi:N-acylneuraminate cytidylyltransferase
VNIAIIPARGGSKRIPRKNVKPFLGQPVIAYTIEALRGCGLFDHVIVSTDDAEIAAIARDFGAATPFARPADLSDDEASTDAVLVHAIAEAQRIYGPLEHGCCAYPVNPLLTADELVRGLEVLTARQAASAFPVTRYDFPIEQALLLEEGRPRFRGPEMIDMSSQDLPVHYHDAGMFYWFDVAKFQRLEALFSSESVAFEIESARCQDVNTPDDWALAELKYLRLKGRLDR